MRVAPLVATLALGSLLYAPALAAQAPAAAVDRAFAAFWAAADPEQAAARVDAVVQSGVTFGDALARLRKGRPYSATVKRGRQDLALSIRAGRIAPNGLPHPYTVIVPDSYDPAKPIPVRVQLHGGVGRPLRDPPQGGDAADRIPGTTEEIYVLPNAWPESMWWQDLQRVNIIGILDRLKRTYNVDENRVYLTGISDGGTGTYFFAFREPTPFAAFLPLNGHMGVLASPGVGADGAMFAGNAVNKPFFVVNGGRDPLYPAAGVAPFVAHLRTLGTEMVFRVQAEAGHNTAWWEDERPSFEAFLAAHPRNPLPARLSWQTEQPARSGRIDWLVIDRLGAVAGETDFPETNLIDVDGQRLRLFPQPALTGRVDLLQRGNTVEALTEGVAAFTLLLSPDQFDFTRPLVVWVNGRKVLEGVVQPSVRTLLEWAARDNDRALLFGAALPIEVRA